MNRCFDNSKKERPKLNHQNLILVLYGLIHGPNWPMAKTRIRHFGRFECIYEFLRYFLDIARMVLVHYPENHCQGNKGILSCICYVKQQSSIKDAALDDKESRC